jgi:hypothetical protein
MNEPPVGQNVVVTLASGMFCLAYWDGAQWWVGIENNPVDALLSEPVVEWKWRTE